MAIATALKTFYFTFGGGQSLPGCYTTVEAPNELEARQMMYAEYGQNWSMVYRTADEAGVNKFNLACVPFGTPNVRL